MTVFAVTGLVLTYDVVGAQLWVQPARLDLRGADDVHGVLVSAPADSRSGLTNLFRDVTQVAHFSSTDERILTVTSNGLIHAVGDGAAQVLVRFGGQTHRIAVGVHDAAHRIPPSFRQEIEPLLTRSGCNMGSCHGKLAGQNGFKLSLRGYAPEHDYGWVANDVSGRRINPAFPEESLFITKPLGRVPHEGKARFAEDSRYHRTLAEWITARAPGPKPAEEETDASQLEILAGIPDPSTPTQSSPRTTDRAVLSRILAPGETQQLLTRAHWPDGRIRDVTWLSQFFSNDQNIATVTPEGQIRAVRPGETAIRIHFQGLVEIVRVTIPFTNVVEGWKFTRAQNPVDVSVFAKLQSLNLPPSPGAMTRPSCVGPCSTRSEPCPHPKKFGHSKPTVHPESEQL